MVNTISGASSARSVGLMPVSHASWAISQV